MKLSFPLSAVCLWLLAFLASFTWVSAFETEFFMAAGVLLFAAMAVNDSGGIAKREWKFPASPVLMLGGSFWALSLISVALSDILFVSWVYFFFLSVLPFSVLFFLVGDHFEKRLAFAWTGIKIIFAGLSLYAISQYFFLPKFLYQGRVQEPLADPNSLAAVFSLGLFMLAGEILKQARRIKWADGALLFLMLAGFLTTGSRGAFLAFAVMAAGFVMMVGPRAVSRHAWLSLGGIAAAALVLIGVIYTPTFYSGPLKVLQYSSGVTWHDVMRERETIWASAVSLIAAHPVFGTGPGTFSFYYPEVKSLSDNTAGFTTHNDPLQFAVELGLFSTVVFYIFCLGIVTRTVQAIRQTPILKIEILSPFFAMAAMVLHCHLSADFHVLPCLMLFGFAFSAWYYASSQALQETFRRVSATVFFNDFALKASFMVTALVLSALIAAPLYSQRLTGEAVGDLEAGRFEAFRHKLDSADRLSAGTNAHVFALAAGIPLGVLETPGGMVSASDRQAFMAQIHSLLARGEKANPRNADIFWMKARLALLEKEPQTVKENLETAIRINPAHMSARLLLADFWEKNGMLDRAYDVMNSGIDVRYSRKDAQRYFEYYMRSENIKSRLDKQEKSLGRKVP